MDTLLYYDITKEVFTSAHVNMQQLFQLPGSTQAESASFGSVLYRVLTFLTPSRAMCGNIDVKVVNNLFVEEFR